MDNDEKQIISSMLSLLKDYCEETQCRFCPFKEGNSTDCQFVTRDGVRPIGLIEIIERLEEC